MTKKKGKSKRQNTIATNSTKTSNSGSSITHSDSLIIDNLLFDSTESNLSTNSDSNANLDNHIPNCKHIVRALRANKLMKSAPSKLNKKNKGCKDCNSAKNSSCNSLSSYESNAIFICLSCAELFCSKNTLYDLVSKSSIPLLPIDNKKEESIENDIDNNDTNEIDKEDDYNAKEEVESDNSDLEDHAKRHYLRSEHPLFIDISNQKIFCYDCDKFVDPLDAGRKYNDLTNFQNLVQDIVNPGTREKDKPKINKIEDDTTPITNSISRTGSQESINDDDSSKYKIDKPDSKIIELVNGRNRIDGKCTGLTNLGNTCFFNSLMQCLIYNINFFIPSSGPVSKALMKFLCAMNIKYRKDGGVLNPSGLFSAICDRYKVYRRMSQQDSHEFLIRLFDEVDHEERKTARLTFKDKTTLQRQYGWKLWSIVVCARCKNINFSEEEYTSLSLPITSINSEKSSLISDIKKYFDPITGGESYLSDEEEDNIDKPLTKKEARQLKKEARLQSRKKPNLMQIITPIFSGPKSKPPSAPPSAGSQTSSNIDSCSGNDSISPPLAAFNEVLVDGSKPEIENPLDEIPESGPIVEEDRDEVKSLSFNNLEKMTKISSFSFESMLNVEQRRSTITHILRNLGDSYEANTKKKPDNYGSNNINVEHCLASYLDVEAIDNGRKSYNCEMCWKLTYEPQRIKQYQIPGPSTPPSSKRQSESNSYSTVETTRGRTSNISLSSLGASRSKSPLAKDVSPLSPLSGELSITPQRSDIEAFEKESKYVVASGRNNSFERLVTSDTTDFREDNNEKFDTEDINNLDTDSEEESLPYDDERPRIFTKAYKRYLIQPSVASHLILHLNRFQNGGISDYGKRSRKLDTYVGFNRCLCINNFWGPNVKQRAFKKFNKDTQMYEKRIKFVPELKGYNRVQGVDASASVYYALTGVVIHSGSLNGGHYTAYVRPNTLALSREQLLDGFVDSNSKNILNASSGTKFKFLKNGDRWLDIFTDKSKSTSEQSNLAKSPSKTASAKKGFVNESPTRRTSGLLRLSLSPSRRTSPHRKSESLDSKFSPIEPKNIINTGSLSSRDLLDSGGDISTKTSPLGSASEWSDTHKPGSSSAKSSRRSSFGKMVKSFLQKKNTGSDAEESNTEYIDNLPPIITTNGVKMLVSLSEPEKNEQGVEQLKLINKNQSDLHTSHSSPLFDQLNHVIDIRQPVQLLSPKNVDDDFNRNDDVKMSLEPEGYESDSGSIQHDTDIKINRENVDDIILNPSKEIKELCETLKEINSSTILGDATTKDSENVDSKVEKHVKECEIKIKEGCKNIVENTKADNKPVVEDVWYYISDSSVRKAKWEDAQKAEAYLLFYTLIE